jgi:hypothetical protein
MGLKEIPGSTRVTCLVYFPARSVCAISVRKFLAPRDSELGVPLKIYDELLSSSSSSLYARTPVKAGRPLHFI